MCGGFNCSKNALMALNILFLLVSFVLIGVASYAKAVAIISSFQIAGGIIACGLFLFIISILGLVAASKHHQVFLFFYFVVLFLLFILQFSISIACLAVTEQFQEDLLKNAWYSKDSNKEMQSVVWDAEKNFHCCGWDMNDQKNDTVRKKCIEYDTCPGWNGTADGQCKTCGPILEETVGSVLVSTGGIGLFFSFTEMLGVYLAVRFRNQKDPKANPSQFL